MSMIPPLARIPRAFASALGCHPLAIVGVFFFGLASSRAAEYEPTKFLLSAGGAYTMVNPSALNEKLDFYAPIVALMSFDGTIERGLFSPSWSHWIHFGYLFGTATDSDRETDGSLTDYKQKMSYLTLVPLGVSYWFKRTAFIDFGLTLGAGASFSGKHVVSVTHSDGKPGSDATVPGAWSPYGEGEITGRFWLNRWVSVTLAGGGSFTMPQFTPSSGDSYRGMFLGAYLKGAVTIPLARMTGVEKTYVEVLPPKKPVPPTPARPAPTAPRK